MIYEIKDTLLIPKILEMARTIDEVPIDKLRDMLIEGLTSKKSKIIVNEIREFDRKELSGFVFATIDIFNGEDAIFIQFCVIKPNEREKHVGYELLTRLRLWGKENNIKNMYFITDRAKAFIKKYRFKYHGTVLKKSVEED